MPSFQEELERMLWLKREGKVQPDERCKLIFPRLEAKKRVRNEEGKTRLIVQLDTPITYSEFAAQFSRYKELTGNPQIAFSLMLRVLRGISDEIIKQWAEEPGGSDAIT